MSHDAVLHVFDGTTGELTAPAELDDRATALYFEPEQIGGGAAWLLGQTPKASQLAVLDAATLAPKLARELRVTDVTQSQRKHLGR